MFRILRVRREMYHFMLCIVYLYYGLIIEEIFLGLKIGITQGLIKRSVVVKVIIPLLPCIYRAGVTYLHTIYT